MSSPEYHRQYNRLRYHKKRADLVQQLGGVCAFCGSADSLEFDHCDAAEKEFDLGSKILVFAWSRILEEAKKCQLLCSSCHLKKTKAAKDGYDKRAKGIRVANSKLTEDQIAKIRNSQATNAELAVIYGVRRNTIRQIRLGLTWKHLPL